jgi:MFS transporter, DHA1 family, multidrug resistance protein
MHAADSARPPAHTVVVLGLLTMFGPLSLDLYLPALPQLADDLNASTSAAQLSMIFPTANGLAMADYPDLAGTASSLQGLSQFVFGAVAAPLVGIAGEQTAVPLGIATIAVSVCAMASFVALVLPVVRARMHH